MTIRVSVIMGGPSAEHEISLRSGLEVARNLDQKAYTVSAVAVSHQKEFFYSSPAHTAALTIEDLLAPASSEKFSGPLTPARSDEIWKTCDVAFLALHGSFGEDGVIQGFLDTIGVPYTGSGVYASAVAMEKTASKFLYINNGLDVPPWSVYGSVSPKTTIDTLEKKHGYPCFVKCPQSGSSRLMGRAHDRQSLEKLIAELAPHADRLLVESSIDGIEFSCGVIEKDGNLLALPPIEIRPKKSRFFDYTAKYSSGESEEIVPAPRPAALLDRIKTTALAAHRIIGCSGVSRTDMIYANDTLFVLETNTLPGMTPASLLPKEYKAIGGTYSELLDTLIHSALEKKSARTAAPA
jgi:D-alanine-D-alanine ligase